MTLDGDRVRRALAVRALPSVEAVAERLVALHATDPPTTVLSTWARLAPGTVANTVDALTRALETDRTVVRVLGMRRTLHVVPASLAPAVYAVYGERLGPTQRKHAAELLTRAGCTVSLDDLIQRILEALGDGEATVSELAEHVPEFALKITILEDKPYGGTLVIGGRLMDVAGTLGHTVRARSRGGWKTSLCSWSRADRWLPALADRPSPAEGRSQLVRAYLGAFGPATLDDTAWWTGLPKGQVKAALGPDVVEIEVRGWPGTRLVLRDRLDDLDAERPESGIVLLPALDPMIMGWQDRAPILDPAWKAQLFDRSGNVGPTVVADGRVIGGWGMPKDGRVLFRLLERPELEAEVATEATRLEEALAGERVAPRFPVPLSKELAS